MLSSMNTIHNHGPRIRGAALNVPTGSRRPHSRNRQWTAPDASSRSATSTPGHVDGERWERGGGRGGPRGRGRGRGGRKFPNQTLRNPVITKPKEVAPTQEPDTHTDVEEEMEDVQGDASEDLYATDFEFPDINEPELETQEERERFYQEVSKDRPIVAAILTFSISWLKRGRLRGKRLSQKGRWTIPLYQSAWRMPSLWLELAWICVLGLNGIGERGRIICLNGKLYVPSLLESCIQIYADPLLRFRVRSAWITSELSKCMNVPLVIRLSLRTCGLLKFSR